MGKWNAFLISLIPAALAGYLCFLLVTIGLSVPDDKMGMMFWGPLGAGFLGCVMAVLTPFGIAIFIRASPQLVAQNKVDKQDDFGDDELFDDGDALDSNEFESGDLSDSDFTSDGDLEDSDFGSDDFDSFADEDSSTDFQTADFIDDDDFAEDGSDEFLSFDDDDDDLMS